MGMTDQRVIRYGGDYNADQWPEETWPRDLEALKRAGINTVTIGVFSWSRLQPAPDRYDFEWLDRLFERVDDAGMQVYLATPTASPPAWLCRMYDDVLPVDERGQRLGYGSRRHYCPNSPSYRRHAVEIATRLAQRYGQHPALALWHVDNEYGCHISACYCERCARAFRKWLQARYETIEQLNDAWTTSFWSQRYCDWDEVEPPRLTPSYHNPSQALDWRRFMSDSFLECYLEQKRVINALSPGKPVTTNFMAWFAGLDYHRWATHLDVASWDSYPGTGADPAEVAARHDLIRGLKGGRQPFLLMEQTPSQVNWMAYNAPQRPGEMRLRSLQAVAHGADAICFFQLRQSRGGAEKFHGAVLTPSGNDQTRAYKEVAQLGQDLQRLQPVAGSEYRAQVAVLFSWPVWWAVEQEPRINQSLSYIHEMMRYYRALWRRGLEIDIVAPDSELAPYRMVVAPLLRITTPDLRRRLEAYVQQGGLLVLTFHSGLTDHVDRLHMEGFPGLLQDLCGLEVEEFDVLPPTSRRSVRVVEPRGDFSGTYEAELWCDVMHLRGARALAVYTEDYYAGVPAVTEHGVGSGRVIYVGTALPKPALEALLGWAAWHQGVSRTLQVPDGVEVVRRWIAGRPCPQAPGSEPEPVTFVLNHNPHPVSIRLASRWHELLTGHDISGEATLPGLGVWVLVER